MEENVIQNDEIGTDVPVSDAPADDSTVSVPVEVGVDQVVPVYSSVDDDLGLPVAYDILIDDDNMVLGAEAEEAVQAEYSTEDILLQINDNIVDGMALMATLFGLLLGVAVGAEVFKIWLQS